MGCVGTKMDLEQVKQKSNETLRAYMWCFFKKCINCFQQGLFDRWIYKDFGRRLPRSEWADEEDKELNKYEPYRSQNQSNNGVKGKNLPRGNYSGTPNLKREPDYTVAAMERTPQSKSKRSGDSPSFKELLK